MEETNFFFSFSDKFFFFVFNQLIQKKAEKEEKKKQRTNRTNRKQLVRLWVDLNLQYP